MLSPLRTRHRPRIFISYRRKGVGSGFAGRLADKLVEYFGPHQCFRDVASIDSGVDFVEAINHAIASCKVLVVVIGPDWVSQRDADGPRRLDDPNDFVRLEIAAALARNVRVIPALVAGAEMPRVEELPEDLRPLTRRQAHTLSDERWQYDIEELIQAISQSGVKGRHPTERIVLASRFKIAAAVIGTGVFVALLMTTLLDNAPATDPLMMSDIGIENVRPGSVNPDSKFESPPPEYDDIEDHGDPEHANLPQDEDYDPQEEEIPRPISGLQGTVEVHWMLNGLHYSSVIEMQGIYGRATVQFDTPYGPAVVYHDVELVPTDNRFGGGFDFILYGYNPSIPGYFPDSFGAVERDGRVVLIQTCDASGFCSSFSQNMDSFTPLR